MRRLAAVTLALFALGAPLRAGALPGECFLATSLHGYSKVPDGRYERGPDEVVHTDSDGNVVEIGIVRPKVPAGTRVPVIVEAGPYFPPFQGVDLAACAPYLIENFVQHGYAVALVAVPGTGGSGGCNDLFGSREQAALDRAVTWLGSQPWSAGDVAMTGISYDGTTPWEVAATGNPYLKTIVPLEGMTDAFDFTWGGGVAWTGTSALPTVYSYVVPELLVGRRTPSDIAHDVCPDYATATAVLSGAGETGDADPAGWFAARNLRPRVERNYRGSVLVTHGLQDWRIMPSQPIPWITALERRDVVVQYVLGQWDHAWPDSYVFAENPYSNRGDWAGFLLRWFDRWLKHDASVDLGPRVQVQDNAGRWRYEDEYPPRRSKPMVLYPNADRLSEGPSLTTSTTLVGADPARASWANLWINVRGAPHPEPEASACATCPVFASDAFASGLHVTGRPTLTLPLTPTGEAGHVTALLYSEKPDVARERIGWGQLDLRFAGGRRTPQPLTPGRELLVTVELQPLDAIVPAGARLVLELSQASIVEHLPSAPTFPLLVRTGAGAATLRLETLKDDVSRFFGAPHVATQSR